MRPTRQETDLEYWSNAVEYWQKKGEEYWMMSDYAGEKRCAAREFAAELALDEARGLITVYSGRAKPNWAVA